MSELQSDLDPVEVLAEEFVARYRKGERPALTEYVEKHPELAAQICELFPALVVMEELGQPSTCPLGDRSSERITLPVELGDFRILREIGHGAMGVVYEAEQMSLGRRVALKVLPFAAGLDPRQLQRFRNEAQAAAQLHHTHIVPVHAVGYERGVHYYAMQYIAGQSLAMVIEELRRQANGGASRSDVTVAREKPREAQATTSGSSQPDESPTSTVLAGPRESTLKSPWPTTDGRESKAEFFRRVARLGVQTAEGLEHAHQVGIVHRDIKPGNLLLDARGDVWITDFGLAQFQTDTRLTTTGALIGTLRYMSPEQAQGKRGLTDQRADIYSLGVTLYELLTLRPAFAGRDRHELLQQVLGDEPVRPRRISPAIPVELETIVLKAIAKEPDGRYATAQELADDLRAFLEDKPIRAKPPTLLQRARKWARRRRPVVAAAAAGLFLAFAVLAGSIGWIVRDLAVRRTATERDVGQAVQDAIRLRDEGRLLAGDPARWETKLSAAFAAVERAEGVLASGVSTPALHEQVKAARGALDEDNRLCRFLADLADLRSQKGDDWDPTNVAADYARSFREHGIDIEMLPAAEAAALIGICPSSVAAELAAALDDWAMSVRAADRQRPLDVARLADPDPWRNRLRSASAQRDLPELWALAHEARDRQELGRLPAGSLHGMARALFDAGDATGAEQWLRDALEHHLGDVWLNYALATVLHKGNWSKPRLEEAIRYYSVVRALRPEIAHDLAHALKDSGDLDGAEIVFRSLTRTRPANAHHWTCLGGVLRTKGDLTGAIDASSRAVELRPKSPDVWSNRGVVQHALGRLDRAIADHSKAIELKTDFARAWYNRGNARKQLKQSDEAIADYSRAIELKPDYADALFNRGNTFLELKQFERAIADYSRVIELRPKMIEAWNNRGIVFGMLNQFERSVADFSKAIELQPSFPNSWMYRANAYIRLNQFRRAIADYSKVLELDSGRVDAWNGRGSAYFSLREFDLAKADYSKVIDLKPDYAEAWYNRGTVHVALRQLDQAIADYSKAIEHKRDYAEAWYNRANARRDLQHFDQAITDYSKAIDLRPKDAASWNGRGVAFAKLSQFDLALADFTMAVQLQPRHAQANANLARLLATCPDARLRNMARAVEVAKKAVELAPSAWSCWNTLGAAHYRAGEWKAAITALEKSIELRRGGDSFDWFLQAMAHWQLGNKEEARTRFEKAVAWMEKNKPSDEELRRFRAEAEELLGVKKK
jgi:tetratricopeptide (TPR) repeat protein/serine/threonine protein kinase